MVVGDALIGHRFQNVLQRVVRANGDRLTKAVFPALVYARFWPSASTLVFIHPSAWKKNPRKLTPRPGEFIMNSSTSATLLCAGKHE